MLCDPNGIDRDALRKLAEERRMVRYFPPEKLSPAGFFVDVESTNVKLPSGEIVMRS